MNKTIIKTITIGLIAGIIGGSLGLSSAPILVPLLVILHITKNYRTAIGTTILAITPPLSILAIREYYDKGEVAIHTALILMAVVLIGSYIGSLITTRFNISDSTIALITSFVLGCLSLFWFILGMNHFNFNIRTINQFSFSF